MLGYRYKACWPGVKTIKNKSVHPHSWRHTLGLVRQRRHCDSEEPRRAVTSLSGSNCTGKGVLHKTVRLPPPEKSLRNHNTGPSTWPCSHPTATARQGAGASPGLLYRTALSAAVGGEGDRDTGCHRTCSKPRVLLGSLFHHLTWTGLVLGVSPTGLMRGRVRVGSLHSSTWLWGHGTCSHAARSAMKSCT